MTSAENLPAGRLLSGAVALIVACGWMFSLVVGAVEKDWTPLTITTPVMLIPVGWACGLRIVRGGKDE